MFHKLRSLLAFIVLFSMSYYCYAESWELNRFKNNKGAFIAGFFSGYAAHELGHIVVADSFGFDAEFDGVTIVYPGAVMTEAEQLQVSSAGFQVQWLVSEAALRYRKDRKLSDFGDNYNAGLVSAHLAITAAYMTVLLNHEDGDLQGMSEASGISNDKLAVLVAIPALLDAWRLFGNKVPKWVPGLSAGTKGIGFTWVWTY
jgi:hypothetical protein